MTTEFGKKMISNKKPGVFLNISTTYAETGSAFVVPSAVAKAGCNNLVQITFRGMGKAWNTTFISCSRTYLYRWSI